jgi:hypothetical protein
MIPYLLAVAGGYLIGNATKDKQLFADGGDVKNADDWTVGYEIFGGRKMYFLYNKKSGVIRGFFNNKSDAEKKLSKYFAKGGSIPNWNSLTIDDMAKAFPYKLTKINKILRDLVSKRKVGQIYEFSINNDQSNKYDTFANLVFSASIKLQDTGSDTVTPGGTYFSQKGLLIRFYIRQTYRKDSGYGKITINASKDVAGGMNMYGSIEVFDISNIQKYISAILDDNKPNNLTDFVY